MNDLRISLFGKLSIRCGGEPLAGLDQRKCQELFCYLLLHRQHSHPRETLAGLLWGDNPTPQSKKYLRQALWQLNSALEERLGPLTKRILEVEADWICLNLNEQVWLDVAEFELVFAQTQGVPGADLVAEDARALKGAAQLYGGDLLEGYYQDWCIYERERLQNMRHGMLDKLMGYCEEQRLYEEGLHYGDCILHSDRARERTHRRMMRLYYLAGDRTAALRQYATCVAALKEELHVSPSERTLALYEQIRNDRLVTSPPAPTVPAPRQGDAASGLPELIQHLKQLQVASANLHQQILQDLQAIERFFKDAN